MRATPAIGVLRGAAPVRTSTRGATTVAGAGRSGAASSASGDGIRTTTRFFGSAGVLTAGVGGAGAAALGTRVTGAAVRRGKQASISLRTRTMLERVAALRRIIRATSAESPGGRMLENCGRSGPVCSSSNARSSCSSADAKNGRPSSISKSTSPRAKTSARGSSSSPLRRSGATYGRTIPVLPKPASIARGRAASWITTAAGDTQPWTTPCSWA